MQTIVNGAVGVHHTATVDEPWDGPAAVAAMPNDAAVLKYCHAYVDPNGKPDAKGSYSFPHARTKGGPANMAACRNGLARLAGSNVPAADKPGVERHLRAHLTDGGADEPDDTDHHHVTGGGRMSERREWFTIRNAAEDDEGPAQVYIYDKIGGGGWFGGGITAKDFVLQVADIKNKFIDLHINSPGGDVFDGVAIYNALRRHPATVTTYVDSLAASAASFIALAGNTVITEPQGQWMIHDAGGGCWGNAADMQDMADLLNKVSDNIAGIYAARTGVDASTWRAVMRAEAWYSSEEAVLAGLADSVAEDPVVTPDARLTDVSRFDLKALGARYGCRQEAPDPPLPRTRIAATAPIVMPAPVPSEPVSTLPGVTVPYPLLRPAARSRSDVEVDPPPSAPAALSPLEQAILATVRHSLDNGAHVDPPAPQPVAPPVEPEPPEPPEPPDPDPPLFDAEAFRAAVRAGLRP